MNKMVIVGVLVGLIVGLLVGYGSASGETAKLQQQVRDLENQVNSKDAQISQLQTQLSSLQSQIKALKDENELLKKLTGPVVRGSWKIIATFTGSSDLTTDYFYVPTNELRINWTWTSGKPEWAVFGFMLYKEGEEFSTASQLFAGDHGSTYVHNVEAGRYYLKISVGNIDKWTITVEAWIPE
jgi:outer membrane murein-binding lipoprotein Lpp